MKRMFQLYSFFYIVTQVAADVKSNFEKVSSCVDVLDYLHLNWFKQNFT